MTGAPDPALRRRLLAIADRLAGWNGRPTVRPGDPLAELVATVLSQNTSDLNSGRAYRSLRRAFPSWSKVARASPESIEDAIRCGGLARVKSRRILQVLHAVREREGRLDLRFLRQLPPAEAEAHLIGLPGVGPKTRACVLLFSCGHPAFPVDTHVHRIARRLGVVPERATAERAQAILEPSVPAGRHLDLHLNLIRLGREICRPAQPRCPECPLVALCPSAR
jgi:endonuclease-3